MSRFLIMSHVMVMESHLFHEQLLVCDVEPVPEGMNVINVPERVYLSIIFK